MNSSQFEISNNFEKSFRLHYNFTTANHLKPLSKNFPFTCWFHCGNMPNHSKILMRLRKLSLLINDVALMVVFSITVAKHTRTSYELQWFCASLFHCGDLVFGISLWSNWPKWNLHQNEFHFTWTHVNTNNGVTLYRSEILLRREISNRSEFTSGLV